MIQVCEQRETEREDAEPTDANDGGRLTPDEQLRQLSTIGLFMVTQPRREGIDISLVAEDGYVDIINNQWQEALTKRVVITVGGWNLIREARWKQRAKLELCHSYDKMGRRTGWARG